MPHFVQGLRDAAARQPNRAAYIIAKGHRVVSVGSLAAMSTDAALQLRALGVDSGMRVLMLIPAGVDLYAVFFALLTLGAVPVLVDPAIGTQALATCLQEAQPTAMISVAKGHLFRRLHPRVFKSIRLPISLSAFGGARLRLRSEVSGHELELTEASSGPAAILFTSGSTGVPKGCAYTHLQFNAITQALRDDLGLAEGSVDLTTFPLFGLFAPALGMTSVLPDIDFQKPGQVDPRRLIEAIDRYHVDSMFGSPALLQRLVTGAMLQNRRLELARVMTAGAPVSEALLRQAQQVFGAETKMLVPYGATESLLVSSIDARRRPAPGELGHCVGQIVGAQRVRIIKMTDQALPLWSQTQAMPVGEIGEITVSGPLVSAMYIGRPEANARAKIDEQGQVTHRTGDVGAFDAQGRLWVAGRKSDCVPVGETFVFPVPVEARVDEVSGVRRSALISINGQPTVLFERATNEPVDRVTQRIVAALSRHESTRQVRSVQAVTRPFPLDVRHNSKIDRPRLSREWSAEK